MTFRLVVLWLGISLSLHVSAADANPKSLNDAMKACANIQRDLMRLACFDKLSGKVSDFNVEALTEQQLQTQPARQQNTQVQSVTAAAVAESPKSPESQFGLKEKRSDDDIDVISSFIPGEFSGWQKDDQITLANGQIWEITDGRLFHKATNPRVEISRGVFGSFRIKVIGVNRTSKVKRIQ